MPLGAIKDRDGAILPPNQVYYLMPSTRLGPSSPMCIRTRQAFTQDTAQNRSRSSRAYGLEDQTTTLEVLIHHRPARAALRHCIGQ